MLLFISLLDLTKNLLKFYSLYLYTVVLTLISVPKNPMIIKH